LLNGAIWAVVGIIAGFLTAYYFERRSLNESRAEANELREEISRLKMGLIGIHGSGADPANGPTPSSEAGDQVLAWIRSHQDADGRVSHSRLDTHFLATWTRRELDLATEQLISTGTISLEGEWIRMM
jgi:hypothetical protein